MKKIGFLFITLVSTTILFASDPSATLIAPVAGTTIVAGTTVTISGTATGDNFANYAISYATGNLQNWITTGLSIPNSTTTKLNDILSLWNVPTGLDLTSWALRLTVTTTDGFRSIAYVKGPADLTPPVISSLSIHNTTTGLNPWAKNGDNLIITANISDDQVLVTENIWADLSDFGGSHYAAPTDWVPGTSGIATWIITVNMQASGWVSASIKVKDFGNNYVTKNIMITADITAPHIDVYLNGLKLFAGDYFTGAISVNSTVTDNNSLVAFSLSLYQDGVLLKSVSNNNGTALNFNNPALSSRAIQIIAIAQDIAGNTTTENLTSLSSTSIKALSEVMCAPNPFNPNQEVSHIGYKLSQPGNVKLYIHDITGKRVYSNAQSSNLGYSEFAWSGLDSDGRKVPNGIYFAIVIVDFKGGESAKLITKIAVLK